jgi:hypothetical protein
VSAALLADTAAVATAAERLGEARTKASWLGLLKPCSDAFARDSQYLLHILKPRRAPFHGIVGLETGQASACPPTTLGVDRRIVFAANDRHCAGLGEQDPKAEAMIAPRARRGPPVVSCGAALGNPPEGESRHRPRALRHG